MTNRNFHKILIANRGEIAVRVIQAIRQFGKQAIAIYAEPDRNLSFVQKADEAWSLGTGTLLETYLNQEKIIEIAKNAGADAIHPGYGFLSENATFSKLCAENDITFIGPGPEVIDMMGNKSVARDTAKKFGVPIVEGITGSAEEILQRSGELIYPVLIKPAAGGGGKGMQIVHRKSDFKEALADASRESLNYFGSDELYVEHYIEKARHIEVQVLADQHGNAIHLFERECTLQRRYQKIIEEAPSVSISPETREKITSSAVALTKGIGYQNAGTIEYLVDENENFYFIEMNTRIQVEHPVTEMVTGLDIVARQIEIAEGHPLDIQQDDVQIRGHAVEARIYAEDPQKDFMPSTGTIRGFDTSRIDARVDDGYRAGDKVTSFYDPMIAKVIALADRRDLAAESLVHALKNYHISGVTTNREFLMTLLQSKDYAENKIYTKYLDDHLSDILSSANKRKGQSDRALILSLAAAVSLSHDYNTHLSDSVWSDIGFWRQLPSIPMRYQDEVHTIPVRVVRIHRAFELEIEGKKRELVVLDRNDRFFKVLLDGRQLECWVDIHQSEIILEYDQCTHRLYREDISDPDRILKGSSGPSSGNNKTITAPLNGKIVKINIKENDKVKEGDPLLVIESMKMENKISAPGDATIDTINVKVGDLVEMTTLLLTFK